MFTTLIVQPIFNLLALIYSILPGHNFGLAIILFTVVVRLLMWPLIKKQLHQVKVMRKLQPEIKRIKQATKGDRRKESLMMMELYKERGISPFGSIGILLLQLPILIGLYLGLQKVISDPSQMVGFAYPFIQSFGWMKELAGNIDLFDQTLFGLIDLSRPALGAAGTYWPALILVVGSAISQYFQSKQLTPSDKDSKSLKAILKEAGKGQQADQTDVNAAVGRSTRYILPVLVLFFTVSLPSALALYWLVSGVVAIIQQGVVLREDEEEMEESVESKKQATAAAKKREHQAQEAEVVASGSKPKKSPQASRQKAKKRRRK